MHDAVIGLGGNLGSSAALLSGATALLEEVPGLTVRARSALYRTPPLGPAQPDFHNAALRVQWVGSAHGLLDVLLHVEARLGRERRERWGPRTVDLDLLWWSGSPVTSARLSVPHPGLTERAFALAPLLDVAPGLRAGLGPKLAALGGCPPRVPWPDPCAEAPREQRFDGPAEALAAAAQGLLASLPRGVGPLVVLPWDPTPGGDENPTLCAPLARALTPLRLGFSPERALVLAGDGSRWRGLLLARPLRGAPPPPPSLPPLGLRAEVPGEGVWLTLLPESV